MLIEAGRKGAYRVSGWHDPLSARMMGLIFRPSTWTPATEYGAQDSVSIRSRLLGREIPIIRADNGSCQSVSIRSRLLGREIPIDTAKSGHYLVFQSAPGFWAGRYVCKICADTVANVSIRSRLLGREILVMIALTAPAVPFQSAPGFWAGRYLKMAAKWQG